MLWESAEQLQIRRTSESVQARDKIKRTRKNGNQILKNRRKKVTTGNTQLQVQLCTEMYKREHSIIRQAVQYHQATHRRLPQQLGT